MFNTKPAVVERAEALLRAHCTAEQRANWEQSGWLWPIFGSEGGSFAFGTWAHAGATNPMLNASATDPTKLFYQLWEYDPGTRDARFRWCVLPQGGYSNSGLPEYDCILGTKLLVEADEPAFRAIANRQWSRDGVRATIAVRPEDMQAAMQALEQAALQHQMEQQQLAQQQYVLYQQPQAVPYYPVAPAVQQGPFAGPQWQFR